MIQTILLSISILFQAYIIYWLRTETKRDSKNVIKGFDFLAESEKNQKRVWERYEVKDESPEVVAPLSELRKLIRNDSGRT